MPIENRTAGLGTAFVLFAAFCWGISGGIGGMLMADGWDPFVVSLYRGLVGLLFVLGWLVIQPAGSGIGTGRLWLWSAVAGLGVAGNFAFYFLSISEGSVAVASTLMYSAPVFVFVVSFALGVERPTPLKLTAIVVVLIGIVLLTRILEQSAGTVTPLGVAAGLLAGLSYALFIFGFKFAAAYGSPQSILTIAFTALVVVLVLPSDMVQAGKVFTSADLPLFLTLGVLGAGLSFVLYIFGLHRSTPAVASVVAMVEPVTASLFGFLVLGQQLAPLQIVGMILILLTVTALSIYSSPPAAFVVAPATAQEDK